MDNIYMITPKDTSATIRPRKVNASGSPVCAHCGTSIAHRRTNVRFCKPKCVKEHWRAANLEIDKASKEAWRQRVIAEKAKAACLTAQELVQTLKDRAE